MKIKSPEELFSELGIELEYGCGMYNGINIRYLEHCGKLQTGDDNFDRWANSVDKEFDLLQKKGQREFMRWASNT